MSDVTLRWLEPTDASDLTYIHNSCGVGTWTLCETESFLHSPFTAGVVAVAHGQAVGFVLYEIDIKDRVVRLKSVCVLPNWQRHGIGSVLLEEVHQKVRQVNQPLALHGDVCERNLGAQMFLKKNGLRCFEVHRGACGDHDSYRFRSVIGGRPKTRIPVGIAPEKIQNSGANECGGL